MLKHCPPIPEKAVNAAEFLVATILTYFETLKIEEFKIDCMTANNEFFFKQKYYSIILHSERWHSFQNPDNSVHLFGSANKNCY